MVPHFGQQTFSYTFQYVTPKWMYHSMLHSLTVSLNEPKINNTVNNHLDKLYLSRGRGWGSRGPFRNICRGFHGARSLGAVPNNHGASSSSDRKHVMFVALRQRGRCCSAGVRRETCHTKLNYETLVILHHKQHCIACYIRDVISISTNFLWEC